MEHFSSYIFAIVLFALAEDSIASDKIIFPTINPHLTLSPALLVSPKSCPENIQCVPPIRCPAHLWMLDTERPSVCELGDGSKGLCCTTGQNHTTPSYLRKYFTNYEKYELIDTNSIVEEAKNRFAALNYGKDHHISRREATFQHNLVSGPGDLLTQNEGIQDVIASQAFRDQEDLDVEESQLIGTFASHVHTCPTSPACHAKLLGFRYRSIDGVCNNPNVGAWGAAKQPMERLIPPAYEDGVWAPRVHAKDGSLLVTPRAISATLFPDIDRPHQRLNLLTMQYGQFLSHDITQSASTLLPNGSPIQCCLPGGSAVIPQDERHFACLPIVIPNNDPFYSRFNQRCMNFVRSQVVANRDCKFGYAKQLIKVTHFIDGSEVYGSDPQKAAELRSFQNGRLIAFHEFNRELLPLSRDPKLCGAIKDKTTCFNAGDTRVNQIISLTTIHTLFMREHNRVAAQLQLLNPHWNDELLYQEARRIVIAILQHITYNEYLPSIIGRDTLVRFDLQTRQGDYSRDYDAAINPAATNEFVGAAFRFGHSTVDGKFVIRHPNSVETIFIPEVFFNPSRLRQPPFFDQMLATLLNQPMQGVDESVTRGLTNFLFKGDAPFGLDLVSLNIQRGRDWALRPYNDYLSAIGFQKVKSFEHYGPIVGPKLASVYKVPDDIDLFVGGLLETARGDAVVGPTFSEIIADQFARLRKGDRYFYEHGPEINPGAFTPQQLTEIRKVTFARVICDNVDRIALFNVPPQAFVIAGLPGNEAVHCDSGVIPSIDLTPWRETQRK